MGDRAYVTLLSRPSYLAGTMVLHHSLQETQPKYPLVVMVTESLPRECKEILEKSGIKTIEVDLLMLPASRYDPSKTEARFTDIWTKIRVFGLDEYEKIVFLDSDMIVRRNMDEIFDLPISPNQVAATYACACNPRKIPHYPKDWIPANCGYSQADYPACLQHQDSATPKPRTHNLLNSGMFLCRPSQELLSRMRKMLDTTPLVGGWLFCDQDLIGTFFGGGGEDPQNWGDITKDEIGDRWMPVPYYYNALWPLRYIHDAIWRDEDIRAVHYILKDKPWLDRPPASDAETYEFTKRWWWHLYDGLLEGLGKDGRKEDIEYIERQVGPKIPATTLTSESIV